MSSEIEFQKSVLSSLQTLTTAFNDFRQSQHLIVQLLSTTKNDNGTKRKKQLTEKQKAVLASGAVTMKGCETLREVAAELEISKSAASRSPGIRRSLGLDEPIRDVTRGFHTTGGLEASSE